VAGAGHSCSPNQHAIATSVARFPELSGLACPVVNVAVGLKGEARLVVGVGDTARALGSGDVEVLGTPRLVALFEQATVEALAGILDEGQSSVGMRVQIDHLQPTPIGAEVVVEANLEKVEGRRITFTVTASDSGGLVAAGKVTRVLIDVERFMSKCCKAD
jgi:predicted thioesterase